MAKSRKGQKTVKELKTIEERARIVHDLKARIQSSLFVDLDNLESEGAQKFKGILDEYASSMCLVSGFSGKIFVPEFERYVDYILPLGKTTNEVVRLTQA